MASHLHLRAGASVARAMLFCPKQSQVTIWEIASSQSALLAMTGDDEYYVAGAAGVAAAAA